MKYTTPDCPECGEQADEIISEALIRTRIEISDVDGETTHGKWFVCAETIQPCTDADGDECLSCPNGHQWFSFIEDEEAHQ